MTSLTPFIGRQDDLHRLQALLLDPSTRLVTLLGSGGIGKTRLALELLARLQAGFADGAAVIPLAHLSSVDEILPALAEKLGVQSPPGGGLEPAVLEHLSARQMLLLFDNFEHLLPGASLVRDLLAAAPAVKILATSREKLGLECENLYPLAGLELPSPEPAQPAEETDSVRLFLQKARQVRPAFALDASNAEAVRRICVHVDGSPLGILLAAAWVEHFSPAEILGELGRNIDFLSRHAADADPRHASMRAVFDSSFGRLEQAQKTVFRRLAFFRGGFDLPAARVVAGAGLPDLITLVDKAMLSRDPASGRYELHELLRQYAGEELESAGENQSVQAACARYYLDFISRQGPVLISPLQNEALDAFQADFDNLRQAFVWALERRDYDLIRQALPGLYAFCDTRSRAYEGEAIFRLACDKLAPGTGEPPHPVWMLALLSWYDLRAYGQPFESFEKITVWARLGLEHARSIGDEAGVTASQTLLGAILEDQGDYAGAIRLYKKALQASSQLDDVYWINMRIGLCHQSAGQYEQALRVFQACLQRGRQTGERLQMGWALVNSGDIYLSLLKPRQAREQMLKGYALFQEIGNRFGLMFVNFSLSQLALHLGDRTMARECGQIVLEFARQLHSTTWAAKASALLQALDVEVPPRGPARPLPDGETLSARELEILRLLKSDLTGPEIADQLVVSLNTVRFHTKNIYQKLGVNTRLEAIRRAAELGL